MTADIEKQIMVSLAGPIAQRIYSPQSVRSYHASSDYRFVVDKALYLCGGSEEVNAFIKWMEARTKEFVGLDYNWHAIKTLVKALVRRRTIEGREVKQIVLDGWADHARQMQAALSRAHSAGKLRRAR